MDMDVLRKRISTFRGEGGRVRISDEGLLMEILSYIVESPDIPKLIYSV